MTTLKVLLGVFAIAAITGVTVAKFKCPSYEWLDKDGTCYYIKGSETETYEAAAAFCENKGGHLAVPRTEDEQSFLHEQTFKVQSWLWIGCDDLDTEGAFVCADGQPMPTDNFANGQPDDGSQTCKNHSQDCIAMMYSGKWVDAYCEHEYAVICQKTV